MTPASSPLRPPRVIGVLRVYTAAPHLFSAAELAFASAVTDLGAVAIEMPGCIRP